MIYSIKIKCYMVDSIPYPLFFRRAYGMWVHSFNLVLYVVYLAMLTLLATKDFTSHTPLATSTQNATANSTQNATVLLEIKTNEVFILKFKSSFSF